MEALKNSVQKTFAILENFTPARPEWGVTELANEIGANKSTVFRFLSQLQSLDILYKDEQTEKYRLGLKLFELGNRVPLTEALVEKTHPSLMEVAQNISETVHIGVLKHHQVFYVDKVESPHGLRIISQIGGFSPAYATSLGKVLLAFLPRQKQIMALDFIYKSGHCIAFTSNTITDRGTLESELHQIREKQFAIDREEYEEGLICVAIPIFNQTNEVVASLSAAGPATRFKESEIKNYVSKLQQGARSIQSKIGNFKLL